MVRVVAHHHAFAALDAADAGDQPGAVNGVVIHAVGGERRQFEKRRAGIDQVHHAVARQQLAAADMTLARLFRTAQGRLARAAPAIRDQRAHLFGVGAKFSRALVD